VTRPWQSSVFLGLKLDFLFDRLPLSRACWIFKIIIQPTTYLSPVVPYSRLSFWGKGAITPRHAQRFKLRYDKTVRFFVHLQTNFLSLPPFSGPFMNARRKTQVNAVLFTISYFQCFNVLERAFSPALSPTSPTHCFSNRPGAPRSLALGSVRLSHHSIRPLYRRSGVRNAQPKSYGFSFPEKPLDSYPPVLSTTSRETSLGPTNPSFLLWGEGWGGV